jgi:hypothetical protein
LKMGAGVAVERAAGCEVEMGAVVLLPLHGDRPGPVVTLERNT